MKYIQNGFSLNTETNVLISRPFSTCKNQANIESRIWRKDNAKLAYTYFCGLVPVASYDTQVEKKNDLFTRASDFAFLNKKDAYVIHVAVILFLIAAFFLLVLKCM